MHTVVSNDYWVLRWMVVQQLFFRWYIGQGSERKMEMTLGIFSVDNLIESWLHRRWRKWEEQEIVLLLGWGACGRRWRDHRSGARTEATAALPKLGPQEWLFIGAWSCRRHSYCWGATGNRERWGQTPWPPPVLCPVMSHLCLSLDKMALLQPEGKRVEMCLFLWCRAEEE